jgi:serine/threonine protein kinase
MMPRWFKDPVRVCNTCKVNLELEEKEKWAKWDKVAEYDILVFLGEGAFGKVYKVQQKSSGEIYAMKVVEKRKLKTTQAKTAMSEEKLLLQTLDHPYIVRLRASFQTPDKLFMIMDFLSGGDCYYLMTQNKFPEAVVRIHAAQVALALDYCHGKGIVYRDLKPENCVLDARSNMVLTDFGLAKETSGEACRATQVGTPDYWAPEMYRGLPYGKAVDYWALGCLIYELITGRHPFLDSRGAVSSHKVMEEEPYLRHKVIKISSELDHLLRCMLQKDPEKRLQTLDAMKTHPWFNGLDWDWVLDKEKVQLPGGWRSPATECFDPDFTRQSPVIRPSTPTTGENYIGFTYNEKDENHLVSNNSRLDLDSESDEDS